MTLLKISPKKQALIDAVNASPIVTSEIVYVRLGALDKNARRPEDGVRCVVLSTNDKSLKVIREDRSVYEKEYEVSILDVYHDIRKIGANPFNESAKDVRPVAFTLELILFGLAVIEPKDNPYILNGIVVKELNWNPFVFDKDGNKNYYQRPFVWELEDNQLLINSIYNGIECGRILIRKRSFKELGMIASTGEKELAFADLIDGKQRLNAIRGFMMGQYPDSEGNYFSDLSNYAQWKFTNHQLFSYAEMDEESKDEDVIYQFLRLNFAGVPQSKEHIDFVKSLQKKM